jgi:hypothetical protein
MLSMLSKKVIDNFKEKQNEMHKIVDVEKLKKFKVNLVSDNKSLLQITNNENSKKRLIVNYTIAGYYNMSTSIWMWSWTNPYLEKDMRDKIKDIIKNNKYELKGENKELYNYMLNEDTLFITGENIDELIKLILYITGGIWYVSRKNNKSNVLEICIIDKIVQNNI